MEDTWNLSFKGKSIHISDAKKTANPAISSGVDPLPKDTFFKNPFFKSLKTV